MHVRIQYRPCWSTCRILGLALIGFCWVGTSLSQTSRPSAEDLFPETTVLYLQIQNIRDLAEDFNQSNMGHLLRHEKIAPLTEELWGQAKEAYAQVQDEVGISLEDIQSLPTGEICFAAVAPKRADLQFAMIMDIDPESDSAKNIEQRGREVAEREGGTVEDEETADVKFTTVASPDNDTKFTYFKKDGAFVITSDRELAQQIVDRWLGRPVGKTRSLKENRKFVTIMNRCRGTKDMPPEIRMYIDPIEFFKAASRGDVGAQTAINFLPLLGLDGLLGIGGSVIFDEMQFESVMHMHVMLANPRAGILEMLALKPGDFRPQSWVSDEAGTYMSTSWNLNKVYAELTKIVDLFQEEGFFERMVDENINQELELDFKADIIETLNGRLTMTSWMEPPARVNSQVNGFGIGLSDPAKAEELVDRLVARFNGEAEEDRRLVENSHQGVKYWALPINNQRRERLESLREEGRVQVNLRMPEPAFAIIEDSLVISDSVAFIRYAIETYKGDHPALADNPEFSDITRKMTSLLGTDMPAAIFYSQPGPTMESMLNLAKGDDVKGFLDRQAEENVYIKNIKRALDEHPLPEWDEIKDFFAPSGGFITSDDSGYHGLLFQLKGGSPARTSR